jgi:hypothetical protein
MRKDLFVLLNNHNLVIKLSDNWKQSQSSNTAGVAFNNNSCVKYQIRLQFLERCGRMWTLALRVGERVKGAVISNITRRVLCASGHMPANSPRCFHIQSNSAPTKLPNNRRYGVMMSKINK